MDMEYLESRSLFAATSAVAWVTGVGVTHHAIYAIDKNGAAVRPGGTRTRKG
jgi:hypothetical protein